MFSVEMEIDQETIDILESMNDGIILTDADTRVIFVNSAFYDVSKISPEDIIGKILKSVRKGSRLHEAVQSGEPMINVKRYEGDLESYCDLLPILQRGEVVGGLVVVKDAKVIKRMQDAHDRYVAKAQQMDEKLKGLFMATHRFETVIANEETMRKVVHLAQTVSKSNSNILLLGESGTGKEVFAQAIHNDSLREKGPFIPINCSSIPENLWESEFFGYETGAFTGASAQGKTGFFELAQGGTLFLDEVGEIPLHLQSKLLRVIEEKQFMKIGGDKPIHSDVRIIAATNQNLLQMIAERDFREDLYYRLAVVPIHIPSLRERKQDIPFFIKHFLRTARYGNKIQVDKEAADVLMEYAWPGNVRELRNAVEYALNFMQNDRITVDSLPYRIQRCYLEQSSEKSLKERVAEFENKIIRNEISFVGDSLKNRKLVAEKLGISIATLYKKLSNHSQIIE